MTDYPHTLDVPASSIAITRGIITAGDFTPTNVGSTWTQVTGVTCPVAAAVGDYVMFVPTFMIDPTGSTFFDIAVKVSGSFVRFASSDDATSALEGDPGFYSDYTFVGAGGGVMDFVVTANDLDAGNVVFAAVYSGTGTTGKLYASANYPFRWRAINFGPATVS